MVFHETHMISQSERFTPRIHTDIARDLLPDGTSKDLNSGRSLCNETCFLPRLCPESKKIKRNKDTTEIGMME